MLVYHDECIFHANEGQRVLWAEDGKIPIHPKTQGRGLTVSDFVTEHDGLLALTDKEYLKAHDTTPNISKYACETIKYGASGDGYWNNDKFLKQVKKAVDIAEAKYPGDKYTVMAIVPSEMIH